MNRKTKDLISFWIFVLFFISSNLGIIEVNDISIIEANTSENNLYVNFVGEVDLGGAGYKIKLENNRIYVSSNNGIEIIDIQNPTAPIRISTVEEGEMGYDVKNNIIYTTNSNGLVIIDVTDANAPEILGTSDEGQWAYNLRVNNTLAFGIEGGDMNIYDISNLNDPVRVGQYVDSGRGNDIIIYGEIAYYADPDEGLEVINVSDYSNPEKIRTISNTLGAWDLYLNDELLYLGCHGAGLRVLDISNPTNPVVIRNYNDGGEVYGVCGNNSYIILGDLQEGVEVLNYTNPSQLIEVASYVATPHDIEYRGNYIYVADQDNGFLLLELSDTEIENTNEVNLFYGILLIPIAGINITFEFRRKRKENRQHKN